MSISSIMQRGFVLLALLGASAVTGCGNTAAVPAVEVSTAAESKPTGKAVTVAIDYGDGFQKLYTNIAWEEADTVMKSLEKAQAHAHPLPFLSTGSGATSFVSEIDGVKNEGGGSTKKNWLLWVNGKFSDLGPGSYALKPGDQVLWKFDLWPVK